MDVRTAIAAAVMFPTAIEAQDLEVQDEHSVASADVCWQSESLSVASEKELTTVWRIDGMDASGTRFFAVPDFALGARPLRIDTYVPEFSSLSHPLRRVLDLDHAMSAGGDTFKSQPVARYISAVLQAWSIRLPDLVHRYWDLPFGSRIVLENVVSDYTLVNVHLVPIWEVEQQWHSVPALQKMWSLTAQQLPEILDLRRLEFICQMHDSISLVGVSDTGSAQVMVFKSVLDDLQYLYHELKELLRMPPHPNIVSKPKYIITKMCRFGGKIGVCGFLVDYHAAGTMARVLSSPQLPPILERLEWGRQLVLAIMHVDSSPVGFYSNLKLANIVMAGVSPALRPILIDFEQRTGWSSWSPPEIQYVQYMEHLASYSTLASTRARYKALLQQYITCWEPHDTRARYNNPNHGYSAPWGALAIEEKQSAQTFMLGKVLWCVFEGIGSISSWISVDSFREPPCETLFPTFLQTPLVMRDCIRKCTAGAPEWEGRYPAVVRREGKLHTLDGRAAAAAVQHAAKTWWHGEMVKAEKFVAARAKQKIGLWLKHDEAACLSFMRQRPSLEEVLSFIDEAKKSRTM